MSSPSQVRCINLSGHSLTAITSNDDAPGRPVVFIHGITATPGIWLPSMPDEVRNRRRWISLSLPGHYPASVDRAAFRSWLHITPEIWSGWYETALQTLVGDESVDVVGWSTGALTAFALAACHSRRVHRILSLCGFAVGSQLRLIRAIQSLRTNRLTGWGMPLGFRLIAANQARFDDVMNCAVGDHAAFRSSPYRVETMNEWFTAFGQHDSIVMSDLLAKIVQFDLTRHLSRIECPVLMVAGTKDSHINPDHPKWIAGQLNSSQLIEWEGAGHLFFCERSHEYQTLLVDWLARS